MSQHVTLIYDDAVAVTKSDSTADSAGPFAAIYSGEGGDIKITTERGSTVTLKSTPAGVIIPIWTQRVWSTGTTPATVLGLYEAGYKGKPATT